jgi:potassium-transporting ATPase potassium-binding subunit
LGVLEMAVFAYGQIALYLAVLAVLALPLGVYIHKVMESVATPLSRLFRPVECAPMSWSTYTLGLIVFNAVGALFLYAIQRWQGWLPLNPTHFGGVSPDSAFNTAVSFASNTSWQSYAGETTLSYLTQMLGITVQSFLSGATGIAVLMALLRGFSRVETRTLGNVWVDLTRATLFVLLPLSCLLAVVLVAQGSIQNLRLNQVAGLVEPASYSQPKLDASGRPLLDAQGQPVIETATTRTQVLPMGPVASQTAIALLSGDGGGFFNANSAHPYANPTPLSNFLEMIAILLIPAALCHTFGRVVGDRRQGWAMFAAMALVFVLMSVIAIRAEQLGNPSVSAAGVDQSSGPVQAGGNMEGKETRFGIVSSALFAVVTTSGGDGAVNSMHDSFTPIGGLVPMTLMQLGEVIFGGPGSGLYAMLMYAVIAVFVASLMIGRAPEYLGKRIEAFELKMASLVILIAPLLALVETAISVLCAAGRSGPSNPGAHGFSEILYAFSSAANNNGSAFAGLSANTPYYNVMIGIAMWFGRFLPMVAVMAIAGSLAAKKCRSAGPGTLPTHRPLFIGMLLGTVLLIGALAWIPAIAMGPVVEELQFLHRP